MMKCGREGMCTPCFEGSPDEAWAICESTHDLLDQSVGNIVRRQHLSDTVTRVCFSPKIVGQDGTTKDIKEGVEASLHDLGIEVWPMTRVLTDMEIDE